MKENTKKKLKIILPIAMLVIFTLALPTIVHAQAASDPTQAITDIINNVKNILGKVGAAVLVVFVIKDAFEIMNNPDDPTKKGAILRSIALKVVAAIFLFNPDFVVGAIKFIANIK